MDKIKINYSRNCIHLYLYILVTVTYLVLFKSPHDHFGDNGVYVAAGERIWNHLPVYDPINGFRSGSASALMLYFYSIIFPGASGWFILQILNIAGILYFFKKIFWHLTNLESTLFGLIMVLIAPTREMLHTHQFSGIILGGTLWSLNKCGYKLPILSLQVLARAFLIGLKPHIVLPLAVILSLRFRTKTRLLISCVFLLCLHLVIDLYRGEFLEKTWWKIATSSTHNQSGSRLESLNIFNVLSEVGITQSNILFLCLGSALLFMILAIYFEYKNLQNWSLLFIGVLNYIFPYNHLYDLVLISGFLVLIAVSKPNVFSISGILFLILPQEIFVVQNVVFLVLVTLIYINELRRLKKLPRFWPANFFILFVVHFTNQVYFFKTQYSMTIRTSEIVLFILLSVLFCRDNKINFRHYKFSPSRKVQGL